MSINFMSYREPLNINSLVSSCPAVFADEKDTTRSSRYNFISTKTMIESMMNKGFYPYQISQAKTRSVERMNFVRHAICFRHESNFGNFEQEIVPQIVIMNAHDGTSCYNIYCGFFRFVCSNGLIVGNTLSNLKVYHKGNNTMNDIIDVSFKVLDTSKHMLEVIDEWKTLSLNREQRLELAATAHELKFEHKDTPIKPEQFLTVHNYNDYKNENTLWNTYNIIQENLMKGGLVGWKNTVRNKKNEHLKVTTRKITNIQQNIKYNTKLWDAAENMYALAA